jgi:integrase
MEMISTYASLSEPRLATWGEIDMDNKIWNVPPEHRKTGYVTNAVRPIPITTPMVAVLEEMQRRRTDPSDDALVFPSPITGRALDGNTLMRFIRLSLKWPTRVHAHGFRTTLQGWAKNKGYPRHLIDAQLDHVAEGGAVGQAYSAQDDNLEHRRNMMEDWATFCNQTEPLPAKIINLPKRTSA